MLFKKAKTLKTVVSVIRFCSEPCLFTVFAVTNYSAKTTNFATIP